MRKRKSTLTSVYFMRFPRVELEALRYVAQKTNIALEIRRLVLFGLKHSGAFDWDDFKKWLEETVYPKEGDSVREALAKGLEDMRQLMEGGFVRPPDSPDVPLMSPATVRSFLNTQSPIEGLKQDLPPLMDDDAVASFMSDSTEKKKE